MKKIQLGFSRLVAAAIALFAASASLWADDVVAKAGEVITVSDPQPGVEYVAREGVVQFGDVSAEGLGSVVGRWEFDDPSNPGKDSGLVGNDLAVSNSVAVVDDEVRGKVAEFGADSCLFGMGPDRSIKQMPTENSSYTMAAWVKKSSAPNESALFFWGELPFLNYSGVLCRITKGTHVYVSHDSSGLHGSDITDIASWHHVAVTYDGQTKLLVVYTDGIQAGTKTYGAANAAVAKNFSIGFPWSNYASFPNGLRMDDAILFNRSLSADEVMALKNGTFTTDPATIPEGAGLSTIFNGEVRMAGEQTVAEIGGGAVRGGVTMPLGGTLTVTGLPQKVTSVYSADIAGDASLVKDGAATRLVLTAPLSYTGETRVKAGTLALGSSDMPFAAYDFEDTNLGVDSSGNGRTLTVNGPTRVWDEERGGYVARFSAASKQDLNASVDSATELVGNSDYTFSVWAKPTSSCKSAGSFISFGNNNSQNYQQIQFRFYSFSNRTLALAHWGVDFTQIPSTDVSPAGEWHNYVAVKNGTNYWVYVDGVQKYAGSNTTKLNLQSDHRLHIGSYFGTNDARFFDGDMDDVRIYAYALDETAVKALNARAMPQTSLPDPVLHYAFEDAANPGRDSSASGCDLTATGSLTCDDSPLGGKALKFDETALSYLSVSPLPPAIPAAGEPMTVTFWVQGGAKDDYDSWIYPTFVSWGNPGTEAIDFMAAYSSDLPWRPRVYIMKNNGSAADSKFGNQEILLPPSAPDAMRWHHFAVVYDPRNGVTTYIDGQYVADGRLEGMFTNVRTDEGTFYLGLKANALEHPFRGRLDEVKVYAAALSKAQVRTALRAEQGQGMRVLPASTPLTVDAGARLAVEVGEQSVSSLAGGGTVSIATNACLTASVFSNFTGTVTGTGTFGIADGSILDFGDGSSPLLTVEGTIALGANVTVPSSLFDQDCVIMRAARFDGVENLGTWNVAMPGSRSAEFKLSADGKSLLVHPSGRGFILIVH